MEICLDFDGTCVTHEYPYIGKDSCLDSYIEFTI